MQFLNSYSYQSEMYTIKVVVAAVSKRFSAAILYMTVSSNHAVFMVGRVYYVVR